MSKRSVIVVGAGVSGLAAAYALSKREDGPQVTVLESSDRLGGKVAANDIAGRIVDAGPDALLVRDPAVKALLAEIGLAERITPPAARGSFVWTRGRLRTLPPATLFGVPEKLKPLLTSGLISWPGLIRAAIDFVRPRLRLGDDPTVGEMLRPRLGAEVFDKLIDPLLGGIYAGRADVLSARSAVPEVAAILKPARSVYLTMRAREASQPKAAGAPAPALINFPGGMMAIIHALSANTKADFEFGADVVSIEMGNKRWRVFTADGRKFKADDVVIATPAHAAASLLRSIDGELADALADIPYADVANVTFVYPTRAIDPKWKGTGFLVPAVDGRFIVGCTWMDQKWGRGVLIPSGTGHPEGEDVTIIRTSVGRHGDNAWLTMDDATIASRAHAELVAAMGITAPPLSSKVQRWPASMPQYTVGHADRLATIDARIARHPGLHITGAGYRGIGVAACLTKSQAIADRIGATA
jgi:oxygen-dependent protoporphyrinogen oxidase